MVYYGLRSIVTVLIFCTAATSWAKESQGHTPQPVTLVPKYLLYTPQPVATRQKSPSQEGIIVQEIDIQKGDTLYHISRKFSGHGMYFPQILLFNSIQNPNLIYPGNKLKVPITQHVGNDESAGSKPLDKSDRAKTTGAKAAAPAIKSVTQVRQVNISPQNTELSLSELKLPETAKRIKNSKSTHRKKASLPTSNNTVSELPAVTTLSAPVPASYTRQTSRPNPTVEAVSGQKLFEAAVKAYRVDDCRTTLELLDRYLVSNSGSPLAADANLYKAECYLKLSAQ